MSNKSGKVQAKSRQLPKSQTPSSGFAVRPFPESASHQASLDPSGTKESQSGGMIENIIENINRSLSSDRSSPSTSPLPTGVQAKLTLGIPGDLYEQEADRVARQVVDEIHSSPSPVQNHEPGSPDQGGGPVQRKITVQAAGDAEGEISNEWEGELMRARGGGMPLSPTIREPMERSFGADFGGVRVHTGAQADSLARSIHAKAFTTGQDVFFRQGAYEPGSRGGQELIAHELTHVRQQGGHQERPQTIQRLRDRQGSKMTPEQIKHANRIRKARGLKLLPEPQPTNEETSTAVEQPQNTVEAQNNAPQESTNDNAPVVEQPQNTVEAQNNAPQQPANNSAPVAQNLDVPQILKQLKSWNAVKEHYLADSKAMQQFVDYRAFYVDGKINELRQKYKNLISKSVGSTDLSSDYDITIATPGTGDDVEAVNEFNNMVKAEFGVQPGTLFDTNLYAKDFLKVQENINSKDRKVPEDRGDQDLSQPEAELGKFSDLDQDVAALVKQRRFMNQAEWDQYTQSVVDKITDSEQRKAVLKQYEEADSIYQIAAHELLAEVKKGVSPEEQDKVKQHAKEELGQEEQQVLDTIEDQNLREMLESQLLGEQELRLISHDQGDLVLEKSNDLYIKRMRQVRVLQAQISQSENDSNTNIDAMKAEVKKLLGEACFFAAEAYHSEGAVKHVVAGLQGNNKEEALAKLSPEHILQSYNEQLGDFLKDIMHYTPQEKEADGSPGITFYRSSKYLFRVFDAVLEIRKREQFKDLTLEIENLGTISDLATKVDKELVQIRKGKYPSQNSTQEEKNEAAIESVKKIFGVSSSSELKALILQMSIEFNQKVRNLLSFKVDDKTKDIYFKNVKMKDSSRS